MDSKKFPNLEISRELPSFDISDLSTGAVITQVKAAKDSIGKVQFKVVYGNEDDFVNIDEKNGTIILNNPSGSSLKGIGCYVHRSFSPCLWITLSRDWFIAKLR